MKKTIFLPFLFLISFVSSFSQDVERKWGVELSLGKNEYRGDRGNGFLTTKDNIYLFGGIGVNRYMSPTIDASFQVTYGQYGYIANRFNQFHGNKTDGSLLMRYKLNNGNILPVNSVIAPFLTAGIGFASYSGDSIGVGGSMILPVGLGVKVRLSSVFALQYQLTFNINTDDNADRKVDNKPDNFVKHSVSLVVSFGKSNKYNSDCDCHKRRYR
jgi:hypothetical protein